MAIYELFLGPKETNRNRRATYVSTTFISIGVGMLFSNFVSIFILILANESTTMLGLVTMVAGLISTACIFPAGDIVEIADLTVRVVLQLKIVKMIVNAIFLFQSIRLPVRLFLSLANLINI